MNWSGSLWTLAEGLEGGFGGVALLKNKPRHTSWKCQNLHVRVNPHKTLFVVFSEKTIGQKFRPKNWSFLIPPRRTGLPHRAYRQGGRRKERASLTWKSMCASGLQSLQRVAGGPSPSSTFFPRKGKSPDPVPHTSVYFLLNPEDKNSNTRRPLGGFSDTGLSLICDIFPREHRGDRRRGGG